MSAFLPDMPTTDALSPLLQILSPETLRLEHIETSSPTVKPPGISRSSSSSSSSSSKASSASFDTSCATCSTACADSTVDETPSTTSAFIFFFAFAPRIRTCSLRGGGARGGSPSLARTVRSTAPNRIASSGPKSSVLLSISQSNKVSSAVAPFTNAFSNATKSSPPRLNLQRAIASGLAGKWDVSPMFSNAISVSKSMTFSPPSPCTCFCKSSNVLTLRFCNSSRHAWVAASREPPGVLCTSLAFSNSRYIREPVPDFKNFGSCAMCISTAIVRSSGGKSA
mmetsp:Transcript_22231/g.35640  ORF Transcript_22231/g.35640 Transcript_22231/m.35640 type:complete len:282 (-) Transcript_22231:3343-4188(-)